MSYLTANDWVFSAELDSTTLNVPAPCHEIVLLCELGRQAAVNGLSSGTSKRLKSARLRVTTVR
jgi:hypothetical protein